MKLRLLIASFGLLSCTFAQTPNWAEDVAPILYNNCTSCHNTGGIAPFSLVGYTAANNYKYSIKNAAVKRTMPPWPADPNYKRYAHERVLSNEEIQIISDWVDNGAAQGDLSKAPADPAPKTETSIQAPDMKLKMPDYSVKTTQDEYRCFVLPTNLSAEKFLTAIEVVPGNMSVVHHVLVFHDTSSLPLQLDNADPDPGYLGFGSTGSNSSKLIGVWVPGQDPFQMPPGMGIRLEKKGYIILQVHYPPLVNNVVDSSKVYFKFSSTPLREVFIGSPLNHVAPSLQNGPLFIPANQTKSFTAKYTLPADVSIFAVAPHMHLLGKSITAYGVLGKDTSPYVHIPKWDFHWQRTYIFPKVQKVAKNTILWGQASYDNTTANPMNPNSPPKAVTLGEGTGDEMLLVYFWYSLYQNGDENIVIDGNAPKNVGQITLKPMEVLVYPNPAQDKLQVLCNQASTSPLQCKIYDLHGALFMQTTFSKEVTLDLTDLSSGSYVLSVENAETAVRKKIMRY